MAILNRYSQIFKQMMIIQRNEENEKLVLENNSTILVLSEFTRNVLFHNFCY